MEMGRRMHKNYGNYSRCSADFAAMKTDKAAEPPPNRMRCEGKELRRRENKQRKESFLVPLPSLRQIDIRPDSMC